MRRNRMSLINITEEIERELRRGKLSFKKHLEESIDYPQWHERILMKTHFSTIEIQ